MCSNVGAHYLIHRHRVAPNAALRLFQREFGHHSGQTGVHTSRSFAECILPTHKVLHTESPSLHIGKFTADGRWLVCFSLELESVVVLEYQGPTPQQHKQPAAAAPAGQAIDFQSFFTERWRLPLCSDTEQLCRDFCLTLQHGRFLLLASCTPPQGRAGAGAGATVAAAAAGTPAAGGAAAAAGRAQQQAERQQQDGGTADGAGEALLAQGQSAPSSDCCDVTTFHVVDLHRCLKVDQRQFHQDHFDLSGNACASLHDNILALTSIRQQTIHLLHVNANGTLADVQQVGRLCQADDSVPIELAAAAEQQWQLQKQHERQQQQYWMHQQARALLPPMHCPPSAACQCAMSAPHNARQQRQQQPRVPGLPAASAQQQQQQAVAPGAGRTRRRGGAGGSSGGSSSDEEDAGQEGGNAATGSDTDSMDEDRRRRVRRRLNTQPVAAAAAARAGVDGGADVLGQRNQPLQQQRVPAPQQPQQQQQQGARGPPVGLMPLPAAPLQQQQQLAAGHVLAAAGDGGAAAAAAATSAALLDPGGQLITGLRQRLLAFLYKTAGSQRPCDVAPSQRDFQHNFGVLSGLVVWRARLLGRHQLLLKVGAPTGGPAAAADANPNRVHFFGVYDLQSTKFVGFWKGSSSQLLSTVLEQPYRLLASSRDLTPVERCCAAALYPAGFPMGLEHQATQQQQQQQQQPSQAAAAAAGGSSGVGRQAAAVDTAAGSSARMLGPPLPSALASASAAAAAAAAAALGTDAVPVHPRRQPEAGAAHMQHHRGGSGSGRASDTGGGGSSSSSSAKAARERLKFLRQVVLMVLPGLQNLSPSPYLDPHLFRYSKHLSPIIGLRNSPAHPVRFQLARQYMGFNPRVQQQLVGAAAAAAAAADGNPQDATAPAAAAGQPSAAAAGARGPQPQGLHAQSPQQQQQQQLGDVLHLDVLLPPTVLHGGEEVARRQLHLLHPSDPFVLVVVQTPGRTAELNLYFRL